MGWPSEHDRSTGPRLAISQRPPSVSNTHIHRNSLPAGVNLQEYLVESVLGAGGFGITYLCRDTHLEKRVAIKEFFPSSLVVRALDGGVIPTQSEHQDSYAQGLQRFIQEARTLARFAHPHIVRVNRYFEANGTGYMVMDFEEGQPLNRLQAQGHALGEDRARALLAPLFDGLQAVHDAGFLHRDIKPANIFIRTSGGPVLLDFGSARHALGGATQTLTAMVTPGFAPIEQYSSDGEQGPWTDIYAMGGVLYWALTGENPPDAVKRLKRDTVPDRLAAVSASASLASLRAIDWALQLDERERPRSLAEWRRALNGEIAPDTVTARTLDMAPTASVPVALVASNPKAESRGLRRMEGSPHASGSPTGEAVLASSRDGVRSGGQSKRGTSLSKSVPMPEARRGFTVWHGLFWGAALLAALAFGQNWMQGVRQREQAAQAAAEQAVQAAAAARAAQEAIREAQQREARELLAKEREVREREVALRAQEARVADAARARDAQRDAETGPRMGAAPPAEFLRPPVQPPPLEGSPLRPMPAPQSAVDEARRNDPMAARKHADFRRADTDRDGYLNRDEARVLPRVSDDFGLIDVNRDGRLSLDEFFNWRPPRPQGPALGDPRPGPPRIEGPPPPQPR